MALSTAATQKAAENIRIANMKKGKTPEQQSVIDFFFETNASKGCGCLSSGKTVMTMDEYIRLVQDKCQQINSKARALEKIGLDESEIQEIAPIVLASFVYDDEPNLLVKVDDQTAVSSQYSITWIFFSATQIYTYKFVFDTISDNTWESTMDFFYSDITCFSTLRMLKERIEVDAIKGCLRNGESVTKNNYVVDFFQITVPGAKYSFSMRNNANMERSLQAAKSMLREKKYAQ